MATPGCSYFGRCGGCEAQHIDYDIQVQNKKAQLARIIGTDDIHVITGPEYGYRTRMDFIFHKDGVGFREKSKWWKIIDITECKISDEKVNALLLEVRKQFHDVDFFDIKKQSGTLKYAVIRATPQDTSVSFVLNKDSARVADAVTRIEAFAKSTSAANVIVTYVDRKSDLSTSPDYFVVKGSDEIKEALCGKEFTSNVQGFFQNNHNMAEKMQEYVQGILSRHDTAGAHLLDLYGGVGTFGIINADQFKSVTIVESFAGSIASAKKNIRRNGVRNADAVVLDAAKLRRLPLPAPLVVITDPPRSGMDRRAIDAINDARPDVIVYVSCNPRQLARELPRFKGYTVKSAALFDLFPQTPHGEAVVELVRASLDLLKKEIARKTSVSTMLTRTDVPIGT